MKKLILLIIVIQILMNSIQGQNTMDSLKIDTIKLHQHSITINYPASFYKNENIMEYGGYSFFYASPISISYISIMEAANSKMSFGEDCIITDKVESEHRFTEKGICPLKGYFRCDYYKGTRIKISYSNVAECEHSFFDYLLDSVIVKSHN